MQRPRGIVVTACLVAILHALGFFLIEGQVVDDVEVYYVGATIVVLCGLVLWWYWKGLNWARWIVLLESFSCVWSLKYLRGATPVEISMIVAEGILAVFFLVYLNTKPVRAWFEGAL